MLSGGLIGEQTRETRSLLNQDMGEANAGNGGQILCSWEEPSLHFMLPLTVHFPIRDHKMLNMGYISTFSSVVRFSSDCFTDNFPHFLASEQLKFHIFAPPQPAHTVNTHGYIHTDPSEEARNSCIMEAGGRRRTKLIAILAVYQANITSAHCQQHMD